MSENNNFTTLFIKLIEIYELSPEIAEKLLSQILLSPTQDTETKESSLS